MWEEVLSELRVLPVAEKKELGITEVLTSVQDAVRRFVPADWASNPHMRVSDLTRETLRKTLTVFMGTGAKDVNGQEYAAPFQHQGTGTINTLVLALLSLIADLMQNVIFAMEEPEIAIPPHAQKCIIDSVRGKSAQAIFTSHSPYVLEEFPPEQVLVLRREGGVLTAIPASLPPAVRPKKYNFARKALESSQLSEASALVRDFRSSDACQWACSSRTTSTAGYDSSAREAMERQTSSDSAYGQARELARTAQFMREWSSGTQTDFTNYAAHRSTTRWVHRGRYRRP